MMSEAIWDGVLGWLIRLAGLFWVFGSFMLLFFVFYGVASAAALGSLSKMWPDPNGRNFTLSALAYGLGGLWVLFVLLRHWHACTTTK